MGLFDKILGKKTAPDNSGKEMETVQLQKGDAVISTGGNSFFKLVRQLTDEQKEKIHKSTILLRSGQLFTHYWTDNLICTDRNDPEWQNKVMFFWKAEEPFPKKSLPPIFETFKVKHFLFAGDTSRITLKVAQAMPWFGMPGMGEKHVCELNGQKVSIPELNKLGLVDYIEPVELSNDNLDILENREAYFFLIDERIVTWRNGSFYLEDKPISIDVAYAIGGIHIIKKTGLE